LSVSVRVLWRSGCCGGVVVVVEEVEDADADADADDKVREKVDSASVVWLAEERDGVTTGEEEEEEEEEEDVRTVGTALGPNILAATALSVHPTKTPCVVFMGIAKHCVPAGQTVVMTKLPSPLHVPTLPAMQATLPAVVHGDEKLSPEKRLLYPCACARLALKIAGVTVPVASGTDEITVGTCVMVAGGREAVVESDGKLAGMDTLIVVIVVVVEEEEEEEEEEGSVGSGILPVLVSVNRGILEEPPPATTVLLVDSAGKLAETVTLIVVAVKVGSGILPVLVSVKRGMLEVRSVVDDSPPLAIGVCTLDVVSEPPDAGREPAPAETAWVGELVVSIPACGMGWDDVVITAFDVTGVEDVLGITSAVEGALEGRILVGVNSGNELVGRLDGELNLDEVAAGMETAVDDSSTGMMVSSPPSAVRVKNCAAAAAVEAASVVAMVVVLKNVMPLRGMLFPVSLDIRMRCW